MSPGAPVADHELAVAQRRIASLERELERQQKATHALRTSLSWRLTAPLRLGKNLITSRDTSPIWMKGVSKLLARLPIRLSAELLYNDRYWTTRDPIKKPLYHRLADALTVELGPASAVDVGCGSGIILSRLAARGVDIRGLEGSRRAIACSPVADRIQQCDLSRGVPALGRFDVCMCIEVAEHLPKASGPRLVEGLVRLSDVVVFTAAVPGQGGVGHLNERPHQYWRDLFAGQGFADSPRGESLATAISEVPEPWWIHQNLMVFERQDSR